MLDTYAAFAATSSVPTWVSDVMIDGRRVVRYSRERVLIYLGLPQRRFQRRGCGRRPRY